MDSCGRRLWEVLLFGEPVEVRAHIRVLAGISGHADRQGLILWLEGFRTKAPAHLIVHGEDEVCDRFAACLRDELGYGGTTAPYSGESWDLTENVRIAEGTGSAKQNRDERRSRHLQFTTGLWNAAGGLCA